MVPLIAVTVPAATPQPKVGAHNRDKNPALGR
jgi:hypothetical protein